MKQHSFLTMMISIMTIVSGCIHESTPVKDTARPVDADAPALTPTESAFLAVPAAAGARVSLETITKYTHVAGTDGDYKSALWVQSELKSFGLDPKIEVVNTLLSYPISASLELVSGGTPFTAALSEAIYPADPTSDTDLRNHTFHGYGAAGDVQGPLIYVNYGTVDDFDYLAKQGITVTGAIVIARYGSIFRGIKVKLAQERGAIACLIFSDPFDDGYTKGTVYSDGPWRPESGVQRGSVQFNSLCAGDPGLTDREPGICGYNTSQLIPAIPSLPISYGDALPLLSALHGLQSPQAWHGGLNTSYNIGPGPAVVHLKIENKFTTGPIWNVITEIPGGQFPEQKVILGNHRDAWVYGAVDPNSGTASLLELAKGLSALLKTGWKPKRTIILCSWDGEEYGLLGSTGYGEANAADFKDNAVAYLNVDVGVDGDVFGGSVTPSLFTVMAGVLQNIIDPNSNSTVYDKWDKKFGRLGSGSDYTVFLDHLGIASTDFGYNGGYGVYHSVYDSFYWQSHFGDPTFAYHKVCAQTWGLLALRLADVDVLPFNYIDYSLQLVHYLEEIKASAQKANMNVDVSPLLTAIWQHALVTEKVEAYRASASTSTLSSASLLNLNQHLFRAERSFLDTRGIPLRPWFKHVIQAPGLNEGYAANVFPGIVQYIMTKDAVNAQAEIVRVAGFVTKQSQYLQQVLSQN